VTNPSDCGRYGAIQSCMAKAGKNQKGKSAVCKTAFEPCSGGVESEPHRQGRRLILKFIGDPPELDRIEFRWSQVSQTLYWQRGDSTNPMSGSRVPPALALVFLGYVSTKEKVGPLFFCGARNDSFAASLGDAISDKTARLHELLIERQDQRAVVSRVKQIFDGDNVNGKAARDRRIFVKPESLPADCIEIYWEALGPERIIDVEHLRDLAQRVQQSLRIPGEPVPAGAKSPPEIPATKDNGSASEETGTPKKGPLEKAGAVGNEKIIKTPVATTGTAPAPGGEAKVPFVGTTKLPAGILDKLPSEDYRVRLMTETFRRQFDIKPNLEKPTPSTTSPMSASEREQHEIKRMSDLFLKAEKGIRWVDLRDVPGRELKPYLWASLPKAHTLENCPAAIKDWPGTDSGPSGSIDLLESLARRLLWEDIWTLVEIFTDHPSGKNNLPDWTKRKIAEAFSQDDELIRELSGKVALSTIEQVQSWLVHCSDFFPSCATEDIFWHLVSRAFLQPAMPKLEIGACRVQPQMPKLEILPLMLQLLNSVPKSRRDQAVSVVASFYLRNGARELRWIAEHEGRFVVLEFVELMRDAGLPPAAWPEWLKALLASLGSLAGG